MHIHHILHSSTAPAPISESIAQQAHTLAEQLADTLEVVGLLAVEFFLTQDDQLIVNEMAPRPHNSGTIRLMPVIPLNFNNTYELSQDSHSVKQTLTHLPL